MGTTETEKPLEDFKVVSAMARYGGLFAKALAEACFRADQENLMRIKAAFPEMWAEYAEYADVARREPR